MIKELSISGLRGFGEKQDITFAIPDGNEGSGLTIITGPNNSGKTTIIEAIRAFNNDENPSFSEGKRNKKTDGIVELILKDEKDNSNSIKSTQNGGSPTNRQGHNIKTNYIVQSRRHINFEFSNLNWDKRTYISQSLGFQSQRDSTLNNFESRIFQIEQNKEDFDKLLSKILGKNFKWVIEQRDGGQYYIKYINGEITHSSEGIGDGIWSIFTICAALFDLEEGETVVIDEPELSVHPSIQKNLMKIFLEYSKKRQIVICTHSPYFISWDAILNGAKLIRVTKESQNSRCHFISDKCIKLLRNINKDINNPHVLGTEAKEAFFLEDYIILVEGQEDVVIFNKILKELKIEIKGDFFGWGVGGADKMEAFLKLFHDLGYKHVVSILDGDKKDIASKIAKKFSNYKIISLIKDDIRDKKKHYIKEKIGITTADGRLKDEFKGYMRSLMTKINEFM